ncbi:hypothetical protein AB0M48_11190 [Lentzea sp. NPDC051208]|uniref:hypothetical protein n=1 Tax=Lentzea sp. NPDC051208 TaxID=3154642 RepID=UPI0034184F3F
MADEPREDDLGSVPADAAGRRRSPMQVFLAGGGTVDALSSMASEILYSAEEEWQTRRRRRSGAAPE